MTIFIQSLMSIFLLILSLSVSAQIPSKIVYKIQTTSNDDMTALEEVDARYLQIYSNSNGQARAIIYFEPLAVETGVGQFNLAVKFTGINKYRLLIRRADKSWEQLHRLSNLGNEVEAKLLLKTDQPLNKYFKSSAGYMLKLVSGKGSDDIFIDQFKLISSSAQPSEPEPEPAPSEPAPVPSAANDIKPNMSFYWQLQGNINTNLSAQVYDIDLEDNEKNNVIIDLKAKGKIVICYFSAGTYENWRSDASLFNASDLGNNLDDWPGERWLDIRSQNVKNVMLSRIDRAIAAGCDAIEPDNVDGYQNSNGLGLTAAQQIEYLHWLSSAAHSKGISIGLKNSLDIISNGELAQHFDWALNEQCYQYNECDNLRAFSQVGKAVFIAEYRAISSNQCSNAEQNNFFLAQFNLALDGNRYQVCQ